MDLKKLSINEKEMIKVFFADIFTKEPWFDDWSDANQLNCYIQDLIGNPNSLALGYYKGNQLVALSMGNVKHWFKGTEYIIDEFCVKTELQGTGIGTSFLEDIEKYLAENGIKHMFLITDKDAPAYNFYKKNGFISCEEHTVAFVRNL